MESPEKTQFGRCLEGFIAAKNDGDWCGLELSQKVELLASALVFSAPYLWNVINGIMEPPSEPKTQAIVVELSLSPADTSVLFEAWRETVAFFKNGGDQARKPKARGSDGPYSEIKAVGAMTRAPGK